MRELPPSALLNPEQRSALVSLRCLAMADTPARRIVTINGSNNLAPFTLGKAGQNRTIRYQALSNRCLFKPFASRWWPAADAAGLGVGRGCPRRCRL